MTAIHVCSLTRLEETVTLTGARHVITLINAGTPVPRPASIPAWGNDPASLRTASSYDSGSGLLAATSSAVTNALKSPTTPRRPRIGRTSRFSAPL